MKKIIKILIVLLILVLIVTGFVSIKNSKTPAATYFKKGVYYSYPKYDKNSNKNYFYVFYDENSGHNEDEEQGIGLPFSLVQTDSCVKFKFGGSEEPEEIFKIKSAKDNVIKGSFNDNILLIFEPVVKRHMVCYSLADSLLFYG